MNKKSKKLLKEFALFLCFIVIGNLTNKLPDAIWSLVIQIIVNVITLILAIRLLKSGWNPSDNN